MIGSRAIALLSCGVLALCSLPGCSKPPVTFSMHTDFGDYDYGTALLETDGGYVVCGSSMQNSRGDGATGFVVKTDLSGEVLWTTTLLPRSAESEVLFVEDMMEAQDGGCFVVGNSRAVDASGDSWSGLVFRLDAEGSVQWVSAPGDDGWDTLRAGLGTPDGGALVVGCKDTDPGDPGDVWLTRLDRTGELLWSKTFSGPDHEVGVGVAELPTGGYVVSGHRVRGNGEIAGWFLKRVDVDGNELFTSTYPVEALPTGLCVLPDGTAVMLGWYSGSIYVVATGSEGQGLWTARLEGTAFDLAVTERQTCVLVGSTQTAPGSTDTTAFLCELDSSGKTLWQQTYPGDHDPQAVIATSDDGFLVTGAEGTEGPDITDLWLLKTDRQGQVVDLTE